jgi:hypothetical protein
VISLIRGPASKREFKRYANEVSVRCQKQGRYVIYRKSDVYLCNCFESRNRLFWRHFQRNISSVSGFAPVTAENAEFPRLIHGIIDF